MAIHKERKETVPAVGAVCDSKAIALQDDLLDVI